MQVVERNLQKNISFGQNIRRSSLLLTTIHINILRLEVILMLRFTIIQ